MAENDNKYYYNDYRTENDLFFNKIKSEPVPEVKIGADTEHQFYNNIIGAGQSNQLDISQLEKMTSISQSRDQLYTLLDSMCQDSKIAAVIQTYAEDATERNTEGKICWAESPDTQCGNFVNFLLQQMQVDKHAYKWILSLIKYGDLYIKLYHNSDDDDDLFSDNKEKKDLNEDVKIKAYDFNDHFSHYVEMEKNPAEMYELIRRGKTVGYIKAPLTNTSAVNLFKDMGISNNSLINNYRFNKTDVELYEATEYVHATLQDDVSRFSETVDIFIDKNTNTDGSTPTYSYDVNRGQSFLVNAYKPWRQLMLMENSLLLNRITKSSIVRIIGVEVGDMEKSKVNLHLHQVKNLIEQKSSIDEGMSFGEYANAGPIENNVYVPTRQGIGNISTQQIGGDVDVKSLADIDLFEDNLYGNLKVPKQFFGRTGDNAGFSGGESLSLISSRYAKTVMRIQQALMSALSAAINIFLIDAKLDNYVNKFTLHMQEPTTQEQKNRMDSIGMEMGVARDTYDMLSEIDDPLMKLKCLKSLLVPVVTNQDVLNLLEEKIQQMEQNEEEIPQGGEDGDDFDLGGLDGFGGGDMGGGSGLNDMFGGDMYMGGETGEPTGGPEGDVGASDMGGESLPSPSDLGVDLTNNA